MNISAIIEESSNPLYKIPVFLSYAVPYNSLQTKFLETIINKIKCQLIFPRTLGRSDQYTETPIISIKRMMLSNYGCLATAFKRAYIPTAIVKPNSQQEQIINNFWTTSPYLQIEIAMSIQRGFPLMILVEDGVNTDGVFGGVLQQGATPYNIINFSLSDYESIENFFESVFWRETFLDWVGKVRGFYSKETDPMIQ
ncbi:hypothetical protein IRP63_05180 [Clostridium botulinum]|uniref:Uncharacterized protein n=1 Tax=Clostridium botulinum C/D str. DC5 TaxID=1443128 RepID=A0A0A0IJB3_CLOBO|nr:hypothetical protein [Clostridium botulinum]KEI01595.1 hypothetical protein Z952_12190 [Clostridium botulinum C/D str. BKT75002]KEI07929.1 hypothetical protein Z954_03325 [Clostridium botulinum C/D str. BKT2873]KGM96285.1 hypothetical protein Z956_03250 [Clostridium botulinum D str. CCUG 7971]KGN00347.1 hypothetical protein Z955_03985 [Clostridium botulinum C/D str. DC5]KOC46171.1 hypothetical protein ADU88_12410 [Clostridium botulinum]